MKKLKRWTYLLAALSTLALKVHADIAVLGGSTTIPSTYDYTPLLNTLLIGETSTTPIEIINVGQLGAIAVNSDGTAFLGGENTDSLTPLVYTLNLFTNELTLLSNPLPIQGSIQTVATFPNGNAIFAGLDQTNLIPLAYLLEKGTDTLIPITFPLDAVGYITSVAVGSNNVAILVGNDDNGSAYIYQLIEDSLEATAISFTATDDLSFNKVAIGPDLRAIIGGEIGSTTSHPIIYAVDSGSEVADMITMPNLDEGSIRTLTIRSDGETVLAGYNSTNDTPSIYTMSQGALSASAFDTNTLPSGTFMTVSVDSNGAFVLGGYSTAEIPIVYKLSPELTTLTLINNPDADLGYLIASAADSQGSVILTGINFTTNLPLIYSVSSGSNTALLIQSTGSIPESNFYGIAIYIPSPPSPPPAPTPSSTPYDIDRIKSINTQQNVKAKIKLHQAGL